MMAEPVGAGAVRVGTAAADAEAAKARAAAKAATKKCILIGRWKRQLRGGV